MVKHCDLVRIRKEYIAQTSTRTWEPSQNVVRGGEVDNAHAY